MANAEAKAAQIAAVKATKKKKSGGAWWIPGKALLITAGFGLVIAIGAGIWKTLPISIGSKKIAQSEQAFMSGNTFFEQVRRQHHFSCGYTCRQSV